MNAKMKMKSKRTGKISKERYIASFALATLCFIIGILIGNTITMNKIAKIEKMENKLKYDIMSLELESMIAEKQPCFSFPKILEEKLGEITTKIAFLENQLGKTHPKVLELKKYYSLLEIRHYFLLKERKERCKENYTIILFFYSNKPENIEFSERQGYVLDYLREKYGLEKIKVYSLDYDLDLGIIRSLKAFYNITQVPSMVFNEDVYLGFHSKEELEKLFS